MRTVLGISRAFATAVALVTASAAFAADEGTWSVSKSSGEVWMGSGDVQQASLKSDDVLKPGETIRTGRNGRVLLVRGEESIMIAPNSVIGLPAEKKEGLSTTIIQKAGSILLEVEKKNVRHFEVETPYLAAVVKGTQFRVSVSAKGTSVDVIRGQVEVSDFKSGQIAQVMPGQHATVLSHGNAGLSLGGSGTLQPIEHGKPRASSVDRVPVPRGGLSAGKPSSASLTPHRHGLVSAPRHGVTRISSSLGEVKLNVHRATHGLARNAGQPDLSTAGFAIIFALLLALLSLSWSNALLSALAAALSGLGIAWLAQRQIGGQTGDVLGGAEQVGETAILVLLAARLA